AELEDLSGTLEVTVWPDVFERNPELWAPGNIVLVQVKVRERGERVSAGVQDVVQFSEDFMPPAWLLNQPESAAVRNSYQRPQTVAPRPVTPAPMPAPMVAESAAVAYETVAVTEETSGDTASVQLQLCESEDEEADQ